MKHIDICFDVKKKLLLIYVIWIYLKQKIENKLFTGSIPSTLSIVNKYEYIYC